MGLDLDHPSLDIQSNNYGEDVGLDLGHPSPNIQSNNYEEGMDFSQVARKITIILIRSNSFPLHLAEYTISKNILFLN